MEALALHDVMNGQLWSRIAAALVCGCILGFERQLRGKPAGIRTSVLICLGTTLFIWLSVMTSASAHTSDPARVLGQVVTGVGFLGGGVILTQGGLVKGVTSAAVVWMIAAIGCAIGFGHIAVALVVSLLSVGVLVGVERLEHAFKALRRGVHASADSGDG